MLARLRITNNLLKFSQDLTVYLNITTNSCVKLKVHETLKITVKVENNGGNVRLVLEGEAQETPKIEAAEEAAPSTWVKNMKCASAG
jgi:hypothetical protein